MSIEILEGDCLGILSSRDPQHCTLAYLDPPFATGRTFRMPNGDVAFEDKFTVPELVHGLEERLVAVSRYVTRGSIVVHGDYHFIHEMKIAADRALGRRGFVFASEIIWRYRRWPTKTQNFQRVHDTLLRYSTEGAPFNQLYEPPAESTAKAHGGKKQRAVFRDGKRVGSETTGEESPGVAMGDVWDLPIIAPTANERTGYPTQKPLALMRRLVESLTNPGDTVLDPFCGSGSMLFAAKELGRNAIGIDISETACGIARERCGV